MTADQVSPQPTGPSYKKSFSIFIPLTDEMYMPSIMTLITLIGTGSVFGADQPIDFRLLVESKTSVSPLWLSSGFSIPNTIRVYTQTEFEKTPGLILTDLNLAILAFSTERDIIRIAEQFAVVTTTVVNAAAAAAASASVQTASAATPSGKPQPPAPRVISTPFANTKVLITTPSIITACQSFVQSSNHPNPALVHGFGLQYETILLSQLVADINNTIHSQNLQTKWPFLSVQSIQNVKIRESHSNNNKNSSDQQPAFLFDFNHSLVLNYPTPNRITPLAALLPFATKSVAKASCEDFHFPPVKQQVQSELNPLSPFPLLLSQHLRQWFGFTPRGSFFTACIGDQKGFQIRPISTYYGNTSTSVMFD